MISSEAIYGNSDTLPLDKFMIGTPNSFYGLTKLTTEHYLHIYYEAFGLNYICYSYSNVYGPRQDNGTICPIKDNNEKYEDIIPDAEMVAKMREYKDEGATIVLNTSRNMRTYQGQIGLINANTAKVFDKYGFFQKRNIYILGT